jgi:uncharacterized protein YbjT (DUF2867 family)
VRVLVRDPAKVSYFPDHVEVAVGDLDVQATLRETMEGVAASISSRSRRARSPTSSTRPPTPVLRD